jgi:hypothetical protein
MSLGSAIVAEFELRWHEEGDGGRTVSDRRDYEMLPKGTERD